MTIRSRNGKAGTAAEKPGKRGIGHSEAASLIRQAGLRDPPGRVKVTPLERGAYATDFRKSAKIAGVIEPHAELRNQFIMRLLNLERGDANASAETILKLLDAEVPPLRLVLGSTILPRARTLFAERTAIWEAWEYLPNAAQHRTGKTTVATQRLRAPVNGIHN